MKPVVSIIMGSTSDLPVMEKAAKLLDEMQVPFEMNALSAHRTPAEVEIFAKEAAGRGIKVIIAAAGMAAALPGVIAANTTLPVIGVPVKGSVLDGVDALYSIIQMPPGIPVATVAINGAMNAAILAVQMLALSDTTLAQKFADYKESLKNKIVKLPEQNKDGIISGVYKIVEGKSRYEFYTYTFEGVDQLTGNSLYKANLEDYYVTLKDGTKVRRWSCGTAVSEGREGCGIGKLIRDDDAMHMLKIAMQSLSLDTHEIIRNVTTRALDAIQAGEGTTDQPERRIPTFPATSPKRICWL